MNSTRTGRLERRVMVGAALLAASSLCSVAVAQAGFKIAHVAPQGDPRDVAARTVVERMSASQTCPMKGQVYAGGQLGSTTDLIEGMQIGSIEAVVLPASFLVGFQPLMGIFDFPFFWPADQARLLQAHGSAPVRALLDSTNGQGIYSMAIWHTGYKQWTANEPLRTLANYAGKRARVMPSTVLIEQQKALGLTPVDMPFPETYNALQSGAIAAQENPASLSFLMGLHEVQKALTITNHGTLDQVFMVSKAWFDGLADACKTALTEAVEAGRQVVVEQTNAAEEKALAAMEKAGVQIVRLSDDEVAALREATLPKVRALFLQQRGSQGKAVLEGIETDLAR